MLIETLPSNSHEITYLYFHFRHNGEVYSPRLKCTKLLFFHFQQYLIQNFNKLNIDKHNTLWIVSILHITFSNIMRMKNTLKFYNISQAILIEITVLFA